MKVKLILIAILFSLTIIACTEEDNTYDEIQTDVKIEVGEPSKVEGSGKDEDDPIAP